MELKLYAIIHLSALKCYTVCGCLRSFGRSLPLADAALCVVAYVRPANINDDALLTHRYRTIDVMADSRNLKSIHIANYH